MSLAKLFKHLYFEILLNGDDPILTLEKSPEKESRESSASSTRNSSRMDKLCFFDVNR